MPEGADNRPGPLGGLDRAAFAAAFAARLRRAGVPVGLTSVEGFVRALATSPPRTRTGLYWTARICLARGQPDLAAFDAVFAATFDSPAAGPGPLARPPARPRAGQPDREEAFAALPDSRADRFDAGLPWLTLPPVVDGADGGDEPLFLPERLPSSLLGLVDVPLAELRGGELAMLVRWLRDALAGWPVRRSRRQAADRSGQRVALRQTVARARRTGWEPVDLVRVRAVDKPRRVVMLCDVSQSMQAQATAYLHLMRTLAVVVSAEVFAFATTLTRLTPILAQRSASAAIEQATTTVVDRFGGTRIAASLEALLASHHGNAVRGAIVIIGSDGWDSAPAPELGAAMARLRRRAYKVIWMNPRAGAPGFEPRVASMAAAVPYCDALLPADTFRSLHQVITTILELSGANVRYAAQQLQDRRDFGGGGAGVSSTGSRGSRDGSGPR